MSDSNQVFVAITFRHKRFNETNVTKDNEELAAGIEVGPVFRTLLPLCLKSDLDPKFRTLWLVFKKVRLITYSGKVGSPLYTVLGIRIVKTLLTKDAHKY